MQIQRIPALVLVKLTQNFYEMDFGKIYLYEIKKIIYWAQTLILSLFLSVRLKSIILKHQRFTSSGCKDTR